MAVSISATSTNAAAASTQHVSSFTATSGQPYAVLLTANPNAIFAPIISVTYKSSTLTAAGAPSSIASNDQAYIWVRADGAGADGSSGRFTVRYTDVADQSNLIALSFAGAHAVTPFTDYATSTGASTALSINIANMTANDLAVAVAAVLSSGTISSTGGATSLGLVGAVHLAAGATKTGTGTVNIAWSQGAPDNFAIAGIRVQAAAAGGGGTSRRPNQMGVMGAA